MRAEPASASLAYAPAGRWHQLCLPRAETSTTYQLVIERVDSTAGGRRQIRRAQNCRFDGQTRRKTHKYELLSGARKSANQIPCD